MVSSSRDSFRPVPIGAPISRPVMAVGVVLAGSESLPALRKEPGTLGGTEIPASIMKHADEQTVLGLAAVLQAVKHAGSRPEAHESWGVIAAPRYLGRIAASKAILRFGRLGAASVSPLIIPTLSLHSMSGSISLALGCHGTNFGVGGGTSQLGEALVAGLAAIEDETLPGVWVVTTEWENEPAPDESGRARGSSIGYALALGLVSDLKAGLPCWTLRVVNLSTSESRESPPPNLVDLVRFLTDPMASPHRRRWFCPLGDGLAIELAEGVGGLALLDRREPRPGLESQALAG